MCRVILDPLQLPSEGYYVVPDVPTECTASFLDPVLFGSFRIIPQHHLSHDTLHRAKEMGGASTLGVFCCHDTFSKLLKTWPRNEDSCLRARGGLPFWSRASGEPWVGDCPNQLLETG